MRYFIRKNNTRRGFDGRAGAAALLCATLAFCPVASAAGDAPTREGKSAMRDLFVEMQTPPLDILKKSTRLDMLDYWDADSVYKAVNGMEGLSWLEAVAPGYLKVRVTPVSTYELKLLPLKKGNVVMAVYTVGDDVQAQDSEVEFFDEKGAPLDASKYFTAPDLSRFFDIPKGSATNMKEIREMVPFPTVAYSASADSDDLKARLTVEKYIDVDDYNILKLFLKPEISIPWKNRYK